jgi:hypothetical protein
MDDALVTLASVTMLAARDRITDADTFTSDTASMADTRSLDVEAINVAEDALDIPAVREIGAYAASVIGAPLSSCRYAPVLSLRSRAT